MPPPEDRYAALRRRRVVLSALAILLGVLMMAAVLTPFGPSPATGLVFGGLLTAYGVVRLYWTLRN